MGTLPGVPPTPVASPGVTQATVSWAEPASDGGWPVTGYVVTPYVGYFPLAPQTFDASATTRLVEGLTAGTAYRFRVQATTDFGTGRPSTVTNAVTPFTVAPTAPTIGLATGGNEQATVTWTAPASEGAAPITGYIVTPYIGYVSQGPRYFLSTATSQTITGLTNGVTYRFRVRDERRQCPERQPVLGGQQPDHCDPVAKPRPRQGGEGGRPRALPRRSWCLLSAGAMVSAGRASCPRS